MQHTRIPQSNLRPTKNDKYILKLYEKKNGRKVGRPSQRKAYIFFMLDNDVFYVAENIKHKQMDRRVWALKQLKDQSVESLFNKIPNDTRG